MNATTNTIDPQTRLALANLRRFLTDDGTYSARAIGAIIAHVLDGGDLDDAPFVNQDNLDALTATYVAGFEPVGTDDPAWDADEGLWVPDEEPDTSTPDEGWYHPHRLPAMTPICGACEPSDTSPAYEPSEADWADYRRHFDQDDQGDVEPSPPPSRYSVESLINIRRMLYGV